jgi:hypothetical protein
MKISNEGRFAGFTARKCVPEENDDGSHQVGINQNRTKEEEDILKFLNKIPSQIAVFLANCNIFEPVLFHIGRYIDCAPESESNQRFARTRRGFKFFELESS